MPRILYKARNFSAAVEDVIGQAKLVAERWNDVNKYLEGSTS